MKLRRMMFATKQDSGSSGGSSGANWTMTVGGTGPWGYDAARNFGELTGTCEYNGTPINLMLFYHSYGYVDIKFKVGDIKTTFVLNLEMESAETGEVRSWNPQNVPYSADNGAHYYYNYVFGGIADWLNQNNVGKKFYLRMTLAPRA